LEKKKLNNVKGTEIPESGNVWLASIELKVQVYKANKKTLKPYLTSVNRFFASSQTFGDGFGNHGIEQLVSSSLPLVKEFMSYL
jgi:hypothetical protein